MPKAGRKGGELVTKIKRLAYGWAQPVISISLFVASLGLARYPWR